MHPLRSQRGLAAATIVIVLILFAVALVLGRGFSRTGADLNRRDVTDASMTRVSKALVEFATLNRRLPCPAPGDADAGEANPDSASAVCTNSDGVVPWKTLALRREDAVDGWGRKISYRVYSDPANFLIVNPFGKPRGFTQLNGISMTNCNSSLDPPLGPELDSNLDARSLCKEATVVTFVPPVPPNSRTQFLAARGNMPVVQDLGTARNGNAFVLISHGESGLGAWAAEGGTRSTMPNASGNEFANTQAGDTYWIVPRSDPTVAPGASGHYDDVVAYKSFTDLVQEVKLAERAWGNPFSSTPFSNPDVAIAAIAAAGGNTSTFNTGLQTIDFGTYSVSAHGDSARNVSFDQSFGIGSIATGSNSESAATINRATNEYLRFQFDVPGRYLGITLNRFGDTNGERERVRFYFTLGGSTVTTTRTACRNDNNDGVVNYTINPGGDFDEVVVEPRSTQFFNYDSTLLVGAIATCPSTNSACKAPGAVAANDCP